MPISWRALVEKGAGASPLGVHFASSASHALVLASSSALRVASVVCAFSRSVRSWSARSCCSSISSSPGSRNAGFPEALVAAVKRTGDLVAFTFKSIGRMLQGLISPSNLSGPITIAKVAASTAEAGWVSWFGFLALLSVSLGALNLLPIPVLDGGHLVFYGFEAILGKPVQDGIGLGIGNR